MAGRRCLLAAGDDDRREHFGAAGQGTPAELHDDDRGARALTRVLIPRSIAGPDAVRPPAGEIVALDGRTMGTAWSLRCVPPAGIDVGRLETGVQAMLDRVVAQMSNWETESDISRFNRAAAGTPIALPPEFRFVLQTALTVARASDGAFDPTIGALVDLWGFGPAAAPEAIPDEPAVTAARARCGWRRITVTDDGRSVQPGGVYLDFSGIAKGFGIDLAADYLKRSGVAHFLIEVGGELRGEGVKPDGSPWWVTIEAPPGSDTEEMIVALHGLSAATSGDYRRFLEAGHTRLPHSLDPRTGRPIANGVASVTVIHPHCTAADAYATALTVLGLHEGMDLARRAGLAAVIVARSQDRLMEHFSPALAAMLG